MANYNPPTEDITSFNTLLFNQPEVILSQAEADLLYLSKVSSTISTSGSTTFSNAVSVGGNFTTTAIKSGTVAGANLLYDNITTGTLAIGSATGTNTINGGSTFNQIVSFITRLNHSASSYSFPFTLATNQGYILKNTGSGVSITTATSSTVSTIAVPLGVWIVNYAIQTTANTAGTITSGISYIATSAAPTTQLALTGSALRSISEVYAISDVQVITSSFTLSVSTAQNYVLTVLRTFSTGTYTIVGEITITRLA